MDKRDYNKIDAPEIFKRGFIPREENPDFVEFAAKVQLVDHEGVTERIWVALLTKIDRERYDSDSRGERITGVLLNDALAFHPAKSWGRVIIGITCGDVPPVFRAREQRAFFVKTQNDYAAEHLH